MNKTKSAMIDPLTWRIMRRVYLVWGIRMLLHPVFLKVLLVLVLFWRSTEYISYKNVFANAPSFYDVARSFAFIKDAFLHTENTSFFLLLGIFIIIAWIIIDIIQRARRESFY